MELKEQPFAPTLARRLGDVPHVSGLLRRLAQASGAADRISEWLLKAAVQRGAYHYRREFDPSLPPDSPAITDEEIGIALCLGQHISHGGRPKPYCEISAPASKPAGTRSASQ